MTTKDKLNGLTIAMLDWIDTDAFCDYCLEMDKQATPKVLADWCSDELVEQGGPVCDILLAACKLVDWSDLAEIMTRCLALA